MGRIADEVPQKIAREGPGEYLELARICFNQARLTLHAETAKVLQQMGRRYLANAVAATETMEVTLSPYWAAPAQLEHGRQNGK
jgi:hypothetical protein